MKKEGIDTTIQEYEATIQELIPEYMSHTEILCWIHALTSTASSLYYALEMSKEAATTSFSYVLDVTYDYHHTVELKKAH